MKRRRELNSDDVKRLVLESIEMISEVQNELVLPICPNLNITKDFLKNGTFFASPLTNRKGGTYSMKYGSFDPPDTITLNNKLPFFDGPSYPPDTSKTLSYYTATHEVIHADDYIGGECLYKSTKKHIHDVHKDKLRKGMEIIEDGGNRDCIACASDLASLWAIQYVDMVTHYRTYLVLRHKKFPRLDYLWNLMQNDYFPPSLLTHIERDKDTRYIFDVIISRAGEYCLIDAFNESESIGEKIAYKYTV